MSLVERLEKLAKEFDAARWDSVAEPRGPLTAYNTIMADRADLLFAASKSLRELEAKCPT